MPRRLALFLVAAVFLLSLCVANATLGSDAQPDTWQSDIKAAWQKAQAAKRPIVIVISMDACYYCEQLKQNTLRDPQVLAEIQQAYVSAAVRNSDAANLTQKLQVRSFPTTVIINHDGRVLDTISGYVSPHEFLAKLTTHQYTPIARASVSDVTSR